MRGKLIVNIDFLFFCCSLPVEKILARIDCLHVHSMKKYKSDRKHEDLEFHVERKVRWWMMRSLIVISDDY